MLCRKITVFDKKGIVWTFLSKQYFFAYWTNNSEYIQLYYTERSDIIINKQHKLTYMFDNPNKTEDIERTLIDICADHIIKNNTLTRNNAYDSIKINNKKKD